MKVDKERKNVKRTDRHRQNGQTDKERELTHANLGPIGIPFNTSIVRQTETQRHRQTNIDKTDDSKVFNSPLQLKILNSIKVNKWIFYFLFPLIFF